MQRVKMWVCDRASGKQGSPMFRPFFVATCQNVLPVGTVSHTRVNAQGFCVVWCQPLRHAMVDRSEPDSVGRSLAGRPASAWRSGRAPLRHRRRHRSSASSHRGVQPITAGPCCPSPPIFSQPCASGQVRPTVTWPACFETVPVCSPIRRTQRLSAALPCRGLKLASLVTAGSNFISPGHSHSLSPAGITQRWSYPNPAPYLHPSSPSRIACVGVCLCGLPLPPLPRSLSPVYFGPAAAGRRRPVLCARRGSSSGAGRWVGAGAGPADAR